MDTINILFCGTGGQGILTAAEIVGLAAMYDGHHVKKSEVHGMAQRGGSVESHLRFGKEVFSPIIECGKADFLLSFEKGEHERMKFMLKKDGVDLFEDFVKGQEKITNPKFLNTYLYTKFLKDVGRCYLNEIQLKNIINNKFKNCKIEYHKFVNVLGEYMIAKIVKEEG